MIITVLTPTYNRCDKLIKLKESLEQQTSKNFEWMIVDDGSTDKTEEWVSKIKDKLGFLVKYIKKTNGGKHTALNVGIQAISTEMTIIVDSDDILLPNAIELITKFYNKYKDNNQIGAFSFLRVFPNREVVSPISQDEIISSYIQYRIKGNRSGDMAEVFFSRVLKEYPFPEFYGEKFLSEDVVWLQISKKYKYVFINQAIYQCEYLQDGLTLNDKKNKFASPIGSMLRGKMLMNPQCGFVANLKGAIIYNCYRKEIRGTLPEVVSPDTFRDKILILITNIFGIYFRKKWKSCINS